MEFVTKQVSSLQRVFLDGNCDLTEISGLTALKGERVSYQIAYFSDTAFRAGIVIDSPLSQYISVRSVGNVPSEFPVQKDGGEHYERTEPGLFPDVLFPIENNALLLKRYNYYSLWITVELPSDIEAGSYDIEVRILNNGETVSSNTFCLTVLDAVLPENELIYTQWFHCDGIANYYNVPVFSGKFWELTESFMKTAVHTGLNMILTPIFTPPLDTEVGKERLTAQLIDVKLENGKYSFGFKNFRRWVALAEKCGFQYFEISHLFSQWGAAFAPKVVAEVNGETKRIFGWETAACSDEYSGFLKAVLPELIKEIKACGIAERTYFHISDEPSDEHAENYQNAKNIVAPLLEEFPIIDALSDYSYYESGLVSHPIPCTNKVEYFINQGFPHPWTYYCCGQGKDLSNRFFGMPLARTRVIGIQLFKFNIEGFLQWGYNFYNTACSKRTINPFEVTDADTELPSGDAFSVYPGTDGAIESVRSVVFYEALQDMRAMKLLAQKDENRSFLTEIEKEFGEITFTEFPRGYENILKLRSIINERLQ